MWSPLGPVPGDGVQPLVRVQVYPSGAVSFQTHMSPSKSQPSCTMPGRRGGGEGGGGGGGGRKGGDSGEGGGNRGGGESGGCGGEAGGTNCEKETSSSAMSELQPGPVSPLKRTLIVDAGRTTAASSQASPWPPFLLQSVDQPVSLSFASMESVPMDEPSMW